MKTKTPTVNTQPRFFLQLLIAAALMAVIAPITAGKLDFGTWQRIFYAEFDGQRDKGVIVKVMGE